MIVAGACLVSAREECSQVSTLPRFDMSVLGYSGSAPQEDINTPFTDLILANTKAKEPIVFISNAVAPGFPIILQLRRSPASRHLHICILSVLHYVGEIENKDAECNRLMTYEPKVVAELGEDILSTKPKLVFLQDQPIKSEYLQPYDFVHKYLSAYGQIDDIAGFSVYKLGAPAAVPVAPSANAEVPNAGIPSTGVPSAGVPNAGIPSTGVPSAGIPSVGVPNAGLPNAGGANGK